jgi:hypothetical protein
MMMSFLLEWNVLKAELASVVLLPFGPEFNICR